MTSPSQGVPARARSSARRVFRRATTGIALGLAAVLAATSIGGTASAGPASDPDIVAASTAPDNSRDCTDQMLPVDVAGAGTVATKVRLCLPSGRTAAEIDTVQLLVHGITYDHRYWNIADPADPEADTYSWEAAATRTGHATAAIDRIGSGESTRPLSTAVNLESNAAVVSAVAGALRAGTLSDGQGFGSVALVGHSYGSIVAIAAAARGGVDALVLTGFSNGLRTVQATLSIGPRHYPAALDPQFSGTLLDPGYLTSQPGQRRALFYDPGVDVDPVIIERDEATKGTVAGTELLGIPIAVKSRYTGHLPVLIVNGDRDGIFCSQSPLDFGAPCRDAESLAAYERQFFPNADLSTIVLPGIGHCINAFRGAHKAFVAANDWLTQHV